MIVLNENQWHVRLYFWTRQQCHNFMCKQYYPDYDGISNVCTYLRTIFVYLPLMVLFQFGSVAAFIYSFVIYPMRYFNTDSSEGYLSFLAFLAVIGGALFVLIKLQSRYHYVEQVGETVSDGASVATRPVKSMFGLIYRYIVDRHEKICSVIKFDGEKK